MNQNELRTVGILIFDDVEVLDFCVPFEVFSVARPVGIHSDDSILFKVITIAEEDKIITCRGGLLQSHTLRLITPRLLISCSFQADRVRAANGTTRGCLIGLSSKIGIQN